MANIFNIDFNRLISDLQPPFLRKPLALELVKCLIHPLVLMHIAFLEFRDDCLYRLNHNSQVVYLQAALNDEFDNTLRRIRITNAEIKEPLWFYEIAENIPVYFRDDDPVYFREDSEFFGGGNDFIVRVPIDLQPLTEPQLLTYLTRMRALVDYYKLYAKGYTIEFIIL